MREPRLIPGNRGSAWTFAATEAARAWRTGACFPLDEYFPNFQPVPSRLPPSCPCFLFVLARRAPGAGGSPQCHASRDVNASGACSHNHTPPSPRGPLELHARLSNLVLQQKFDEQYTPQPQLQHCTAAGKQLAGHHTSRSRSSCCLSWGSPRRHPRSHRHRTLPPAAAGGVRPPPLLPPPARAPHHAASRGQCQRRVR